MFRMYRGLQEQLLRKGLVLQVYTANQRKGVLVSMYIPMQLSRMLGLDQFHAQALLQQTSMVPSLLDQTRLFQALVFLTVGP